MEGCKLTTTALISVIDVGHKYSARLKHIQLAIS